MFEIPSEQATCSGWTEMAGTAVFGVRSVASDWKLKRSGSKIATLQETRIVIPPFD